MGFPEIVQLIKDILGRKVIPQAPLQGGGFLTEDILLSIAEASTTSSGIMTANDKIKLQGIEIGAQKNTVDSVNGKTGTVIITKADVGLGNVDNTSDASKAVYYAAYAGYAETANSVVSGGIASIPYVDDVTITSGGFLINIANINIPELIITKGLIITFGIKNLSSYSVNPKITHINFNGTTYSLLMDSGVKQNSGSGLSTVCYPSVTTADLTIFGSNLIQFDGINWVLLNPVYRSFYESPPG